MPRMVSLRKRFAELIPELAKFGVVGLIGSVIDLGGAAYLHGAVGIGPMVSKGLSIIAATVVTYLGSRFWTFRHRVNQPMLREGTLFVTLNIVGLAIAECVIALVTYGLDMKGAVVANLQDGSKECYAEIANVVERNGMLYVGSIGEASVGRIPLPK